MNRVFKDFATFIRLHDGFKKPKLNFQEMYKLFPNFTFMASTSFGKYENFDEAFGHKDLSMIVTFETKSCLMVYKEYQDADENTAYVV